MRRRGISDDTRWPGALAAVFLLAIAVQLLWIPFRWNAIAVAYGAYFAEWRHVVSTGQSWLTTFVGLHPPLYAWFFTGVLEGLPPALWLTASGLLSCMAAPLLAVAVRAGGGPGESAAQAGLLAGMLLAISPHRAAYGLEINNYPLAVLAVASQLAAFAVFSRAEQGGRLRVVGGGPGLLLAAGTAWAVWSHVLALSLPLAQLGALLTLRSPRLRPLVGAFTVAGLLCLPLLPGALGGAGGEPINADAGLAAALGSALGALPGRYGLTLSTGAALGLAALGARRAWHRRDEAGCGYAVHAVGTAAGIVGLQALGVASHEQLPYWLIPLPSLCALAALGARPLLDLDRATRFDERGVRVFEAPPWNVRALALGLAILIGGQLGVQGVRWMAGARARGAIERSHPLAAETLERWGSGVLILVGIPDYLDDDKDSLDPVWAAVPASYGMAWTDPGVPGMTHSDPHWGQPVRLSDDRWLYTFASVRTERLEAIAAHHAGRGEPVLLLATGLRRDPRGRQELLRWLGDRGRFTADEATARIGAGR